MQKYFFREHNDNTVPTQFRVLMCMLLFVSVRLNDNNSQYQSLDGERSRFKYPNINDLFLKHKILKFLTNNYNFDIKYGRLTFYTATQYDKIVEPVKEQCYCLSKV